MSKKNDQVLIKNIKDEKDIILVNDNSLTTLKYYILGRRKVAELNYEDYDKVTDGIKINAELKEIYNRVEIGDKVSLFKFKYNLCNNLIPLPGVVSNIIASTFTITLADGTEVEAKRHFFKLTDKPNKINIGWILEKP